MYKTYDFRQNIRKAFNEASEGREVLIERYGDVFQLVAKVGKPNKDGSYPRGDHDRVEDNGRVIKPNHEHTVKFKLPEPKVIKTVEDVKKVIPEAEWSGAIPKSFSARKKK